MIKLYTSPTIFTKKLHAKTGSEGPVFFYTRYSDFMKKKFSILLLTCLLFFSGNAIGQTAQSIPYSSNPGLANLTSANGWISSGIGSDYADSPVKLKFDNAGDYAYLRIASSPSTLTYYLKGNSLSGSYSFQIFESTDGSTWGTAIQTITTGISSATGGTQWSVSLSSTTRYIKWQYTTKASGNIGMGTIAISAPNPSIAISAAHPAAGNILQNSDDNIVGGIQLDVTTATATLTGVSLTTAGSYTSGDIKTNGFKLWLSSSATSISGATQLGTNQAAVGNGGTVAVSSLTNTISSGTTRYILLTANIASGATVSNTIRLASTSFSNITFSSGTKTGTNPVAAGATPGNDQTIVAPSTPSLNAGALTGFGSSVCVTTTSGPNSFPLSGSALDGSNVSISGNSVYKFATSSGGSYSNPLTLTAYDGVTPSAIFVNFTPTAASNYNGNITISGGGASSVTTAVTGSGINGTPSVTTVTASGISTSSASSGGNTISTTCGTIADKGVVWNTSANPTISTYLGITDEGTGTTNYTSSISPLSAGTTYYYRAYVTNSNGVTTYGTESSFTTLKAEPTNYPSGFACGTTTSGSIPLNWTDASTGVLPDGYLIKWSSTSYAAITDPLDGTAVANGAGAQNIAQGVQTYTVPSLTSGTTYYFKIWSYTNSGSAINYKLVSEPQTSCATMSIPNLVITEFAGSGFGGDFNNEYIEISNLGSTSASLSGWTLEYYNNSALEATVTLSGSISAGAAYVIAARSTYTTITPNIVASPTFSMNSTGYAILKMGSTTIDQAAAAAGRFSDNKNYELTNCTSDNSIVANWDDLGTGNGTPGVVNCVVICTAPTTQASTVTTNTPTTDGFSIGWTAGDGDGTMIVVRPTSATNTLPVLSTSYTPDLAWASAAQIDANNRVVFRNTGTTAGPVTGLTAETQYTITAYEYNTTDNCYKLTSPPSTTRYTLSNEPTAQPTSGLSATTCNATSVDITVPAISAGADGYLIIRRAGSAPTGLPTDATAYTVGNTFGDATVDAIVTAAGTYPISGLTASTTYYFQLVPYNANSGAVAQTFNYLTSGTLLQTNVTTTSTSTSTASTVETDATYGYTANILYASYQSTSVPALASNSVGVHNFIIKDGGATTDADALPTILTAISYSYTGAANTIRAAALFTTTGSKVADATTVGANSITFTGLSGSDVTTNDNNTGGTKELILRVTFNTTVTDNQKLVFTVTSVTGGAVCTYSQFAAADGGGAISDNTGDDDNRIEVVATCQKFVTQPTNTAKDATMSPSVTIAAIDNNKNQDLDWATASSVACSTPSALTGNPVSGSISSGTTTIGALVHVTAGTYTLTASSSTLRDTVSNNYVIAVITNVNGDYRTKYTTGTYTWSGTTTWQKYDAPTDQWLDETSAPGATRRVWIRCNVTTVPSTTVKCMTVNNGGTITVTNSFTVNDTLIIKDGGKHVMNAFLTMDGNSDGSYFEIEDNGTFEYSSASSSPRLFVGVENFHPNSNFIINNWDNAEDFVHPTATPYDRDITANTYLNPLTGSNYTALFGNLIYRDLSGSDARLVTISGAPSLNLTHRNLEIETTLSDADEIRIIEGAQTIGIGGNVIVKDGHLVFSYASSSSSRVIIEGDLILQGSLSAKANIASRANSATSYVDLKGNLNVSGTTILTSTDLTNNFLRFIGPSRDSKPQTIDFDLTDPVNSGVAIQIAKGDGDSAYVKIINQNFRLGTNSKIYVKDKGILDFGFDGVNGSGPNALNITDIASATSNLFELETGGILKITSPNGVDKDIADIQGNVQVTGNRTFSQFATYWYIGKGNQVTGDAITTTSAGRVIICDLVDNLKILSLTNKTTITANTNASPTGGKLDIRKGQVIETEDEYIEGSTGTLYMSPGTLYKIVKGSSTDPFGAGDDIPRMDGSGFPYVLTGGTIELGGTGTNHQYQRLRSDNAFYNYKYVKYSGNNTTGTFKNLNQTTVIDSALIITGTPIVDCFTGGTGSAASFTGNGGLIMDNGLLRIRRRTDTNPELEGINAPYTLTGGTIEFYGTIALGNRQQIRGNYGSPSKVVEYNNLEINADEARLTSTGPGNVDLTSSFTLKGTMNVNAPAILNMDSNDFIYKFTGNTSNNVNILSGAGLTYGSPFGITTVAGGGTGLEPTVGAANPSAGNIRTNIRTFNANASYGFVSPGNMVSGSGLPATVKSLYVLKSNLTDRVTLTNSVRADSALRMYSGHIITGSNRVELGKDVSNRGTLDYTDGYVIGNMRRWYDGTNSGIASGLYPLGEDKSGTLKNRKYLIEYSSDPTGGYLDVNFNPVNMGLAGLPITGIPAVGSCTSSFDVTSTEDEGYWIATPEASRLGDGVYKLSITGEDFSTVTDLCQLTLLKRVGSGNWTTPGTHLQPTGSTGTPTVSRSGISGFSNFGFGGGAPNPLPVELTSFTGTCLEDGISRISWTTASEFNSKQFIVQRSEDGVHYTPVAVVLAAGFSNQARSYSITDTSVNANSSYYRLIEVDNNNQQTIYSFIQVKCNEVNGVHIFYTQPKVVVEVNSTKDKQVGFNVYEVSGKLVHQENKQVVRGYNRFDLSIKNKLADGIYIIQMLDGDKATSTKVNVH